MSTYTTGELAKLCGVTVRTVQYYDTRGVLIPSSLTEGGRRLYSEDDLRRMKIVCFLRELGLAINAIQQILSEEGSESALSLLIDRQEQELKREISAQQEKLGKLTELKRGLKDVKRFSVESIGDIAYQMENKKKLSRMRWMMVLTGVPLNILQWVSIILWITKGLWWLFVLWACVVIPWGVCILMYYYKRVAYICPECHEVFRPGFKQMFFANHTPTLRKLTCTHCGNKGWCVEVYRGEKNEE